MLTRSRCAAVGLRDLPPDVMCHIMRLADQSDRVACMLACRSLMLAATAPGVWTRVMFHDLDHTAVDFMARHRCPTVHIDTGCPDDVAWFFDRLRELGIDCVERLYLSLSETSRLPADLLCGIGAQTKLLHLGIVAESLEHPSEICFERDHGLTSLRSLEIIEHTEVAKQIVVWWQGSHARFRQLDSVVLDVGLSDVLTGMRDLPRLKRLAYNFEPVEGGETYEDAEFQDIDVDMLEITVDCETDFETLGEQLGLARRVDSLILNCEDEYADLTPFVWTAVRSLTLVMHTTRAEIKLDFAAMRDAPRLRNVRVVIGAVWANNQAVLEACRHTLFFLRVPSVQEWARHIAADRLVLDLLPSTCVHMCCL